VKGFRCDVQASVTSNKADFPVIFSLSASLANLVLSQRSILVGNVEFAKGDTGRVIIR
jgi:hypothetical protein